MSLNFLKNKIFARQSDAAAKQKRNYYVVEDFLWLPVMFYHSIGVEPYVPETKTELWLLIYFGFNLINTTIVLLTELWFMVVSFRDKKSILETCIIVGYVSFVVVGFLKIFTVLIKKQKMTKLVRRLKASFPSQNEEEQKKYNVKYYLNRSNLYMKSFGCLLAIMVSTHCSTAFIIYAYRRWWLRVPNAQQILPFFDMAPWNWRQSWIYYPTYLSQCLAGYTVTCGNISGDLMIFASSFLIIMQFERLCKGLKELNVRNNKEADGALKDLRELRTLVALHIDILELIDVMNEVFGIPLLLNFMASSILVCLLGFQLTLEFSPEQFGKQLLLLISALVEIYLLCSFSQMLIDASENVSFAAYEMNWTEADRTGKKVLIVLMLRAQRPVCLKATVLLDVSIETMSAFLRMSYRFFCAIRTMYG
ncbi:odorant receptor 67a [Drosophila ficusphila]|uniref:odorant receptor 67a n=1 Tax=Drosophila ficusphila TaxID=30025 RepID=UPI0007E88834|nr:odorant receptor 67a [Drosophila ficusphila]